LPLKTTPFDSADYLKTDADLADYLEACLEEGDPALIRHALGVIARARGEAQLSRDADLGREHVREALSADGNLEFATVLKFARALGSRLRAAPAGQA
jgi:probable addiction module antidote protein